MLPLAEARRVPRGAGRASGSARWCRPRTPSSPATRPAGATASSSTCRAGVRVAEPIRVELPLDEDGAAIAWRTLVVLEEGAEAEVWEHCSSPGDETDALLNSVVELHVGQAATLRYVSTQDISERAWIFATQRAQVERDGRLDWTALGFGSARGKVRMETKLAGAGLRGAGDRRLRRRRRASTSTTTRPRSTPRPTPSPTSPSAACSPPARPRSGAG